MRRRKHRNSCTLSCHELKANTGQSDSAQGMSSPDHDKTGVVTKEGRPKFAKSVSCTLLRPPVKVKTLSDSNSDGKMSTHLTSISTNEDDYDEDDSSELFASDEQQHIETESKFKTHSSMNGGDFSSTASSKKMPCCLNYECSYDYDDDYDEYDDEDDENDSGQTEIFCFDQTSQTNPGIVVSSGENKSDATSGGGAGACVAKRNSVKKSGNLTRSSKSSESSLVDSQKVKKILPKPVSGIKISPFFN